MTDQVNENPDSGVEEKRWRVRNVGDVWMVVIGTLHVVTSKANVEALVSAHNASLELPEAHESVAEAYGRGVSAGKQEALQYTPEERERYGRWVAQSEQRLEEKEAEEDSVSAVLQNALESLRPFHRLALVFDTEPYRKSYPDEFLLRANSVTTTHNFLTLGHCRRAMETFKAIEKLLSSQGVSSPVTSVESPESPVLEWLHNEVKAQRATCECPSCQKFREITSSSILCGAKNGDFGFTGRQQRKTPNATELAQYELHHH